MCIHAAVALCIVLRPVCLSCLCLIPDRFHLREQFCRPCFWLPRCCRLVNSGICANLWAILLWCQLILRAFRGCRWPSLRSDSGERMPTHCQNSASCPCLHAVSCTQYCTRTGILVTPPHASSAQVGACARHRPTCGRFHFQCRLSFILSLCSCWLQPSYAASDAGPKPGFSAGASLDVCLSRRQAPARHDQRHQIQKRSFRRARNHGVIQYRGRAYYAGELGAKGTAHACRPSCEHQSVPRPETLLPAWPPLEVPTQAHACRPDGTLCVVTLNLEGLTKSAYDELAKWLETEAVQTALDVVLLQKHWRPSSEFCLSHWTWIQSGAPGRTGTHQHQGVAVLINKRLAAHDQLRSAEVMPGRHLRVLIPEQRGHRLRQKPITIINVYQHARSSESAGTHQKRSRLWTRLQDVLSSVPA